MVRFRECFRLVLVSLTDDCVELLGTGLMSQPFSHPALLAELTVSHSWSLCNTSTAVLNKNISRFWLGAFNRKPELIYNVSGAGKVCLLALELLCGLTLTFPKCSSKEVGSCL